MFYQTVANISYSSVFTLLIAFLYVFSLLCFLIDDNMKKINERDSTDKIIQ